MRTCPLSVAAVLLAANVAGAQMGLEFHRAPRDEAVYETVEFFTRTGEVFPANPFADATLSAEVTAPSGKTTAVAGFCDAADGGTYRVRFLPTEPGKHSTVLRFVHGDKKQDSTLTFDVAKAKRPGPVQIDPKHPHHFVYAGTGDHYFWNGTTTYWLLGVQDDKRIEQAIDRLAKLKVNRIRVALNARTADGGRWFEPQVKNSDAFRFRVNPWPAKNPESVTDPRFDTYRFDVTLWQKMDRLVKYADSKGVQVSVIFHLDGPDKGVDPFNGGKKKGEGYTDYTAEERYYRYGVARLAAFPNVMWDVTNEWHLFRDEKWVNHFGSLIRKEDPYRHLLSVHGTGHFPFYKSEWADFAMYQSWDEHGAYKFLRRGREQAAKAGRPMPQVNEEYGYEDHYPGPWGGGRKKPARSADNRRRLAWEMSMAGGYQTTGERADEPGQGGWITSLGNDNMTMLTGYAHMVGFFTGFDWWRLDPTDGFVTNGLALTDAERKTIAVYLPKGGTAKLSAGGYSAKWFNPRTGEWKPAGRVETELVAPDAEDWAVLLTK